MLLCDRRRREGKKDEGLYLCGAAQVVVVNLLDGLEVDDSLQLGLVFVCGTETSFGQKLKRWHFPGWQDRGKTTAR